MWPWEHLALGYAFYSAIRRVVAGDRPGNPDTVALAVGTQFPDLIDKPLAWTFDVIPGALTFAHSLLFAVPFCLLVLVVARWKQRGKVGGAFAVGYLSHPLGDGLFALLTDGEFAYRFMFWPLLHHDPAVGETTFLVEVASLLVEFQRFLATPRGTVYLLLEAAFFGSVLVLWTRDGRPGLEYLRWPFADGNEDREESQ